MLPLIACTGKLADCSKHRDAHLKRLSTICQTQGGRFQTVLLCRFFDDFAALCQRRCEQGTTQLL